MILICSRKAALTTLSSLQSLFTLFISDIKVLLDNDKNEVSVHSKLTNQAWRLPVKHESKFYH